MNEPKKPNDGGQAFPQLTRTPFNDYYLLGGMSLRDWLAGQALAGLLASGETELFDKASSYAEAAYLHADAMLKARESRP